MSQQDTAHAWWSRLRHQGLLLSPVVMLERFPAAPEPAPFHKTARLRDAYTRFVSTAEARQNESEIEQSAILAWTDALLENYVGHGKVRIANQHNIPENLTAAVRISNKSDTIRPHRVVFADDERKTPALLVMADTSHIVGRGRGRTAYSRFLELLRGTGHRLGLLTNGHQFRLVYAGLDFESWCEWESERWFDDGEGTEELNGLRQLLSPDALKPVKEGTSGLLDAVEESRKRQADLSSVLRENVRQAVEALLEEVSTTNRTNQSLFASLVAAGSERPLTDAEAHEALLQATIRVVMRLVVCLFAESRQLLPVDFPIYAQSYGVRSLYELLEENIRYDGSVETLRSRQPMAWHRLMALFRLIHGGSAHGAFELRPYCGALFRPGDDKTSEPVSRALHVLEYAVSVCDATIYQVLRKLLRGPLPVLRGRTKTFVEGPVDYTDLRTEFIGLIYEGLLDYKLKRTDEKIGPQVFLNLGREPVLPLSRLDEMLANDKKGLKDLLTTLRKEKVTASAAAEEEAEEEAEEKEEAEEGTTEGAVEFETVAGDEGVRGGDYLDAVESAKSWAKEAVVLAGLVGKQKAKEPDSEYQARIDAEATKLIKKVIATGEFYLVRAGNTRKGTGTFYTRPQLAVPTVHRTLEPLCYDKAEDGTLVPKTPEVILGLKVCDPACGSASFLVAALHYLADALYKSLCQHRKLDDADQAKKLTLPYGRPRTGQADEELVPFPPNDPHRGDTFADRIKALLRRHVVERCIYGVDINPLAVEFARVSLWVETLDPELPFSFLDHKIKVGNSLVGCWFDQFRDYPIMAWKRECGDDKHPDGCSIQPESWSKAIKSRLQNEIKRQLREWIDANGPQKQFEFAEEEAPATTHDELVKVLEQLHSLPMTVEGIEAREELYRREFLDDTAIYQLNQALDLWCAIWFWPAQQIEECPTPVSFSRKQSSQTQEKIGRLAQTHRFFHWELEFPDVFQEEGSGFDAVVGNPPWDTAKPKSQEFFSEYDPLFRTYSKEDAVAKQEAFFHSDSAIEIGWLEYSSDFAALSNWVGSVFNPAGYSPRTADGPSPLNLMEKGPQWRKSDQYHASWSTMRKDRTGYVDPKHPFRHQGGADVNLYKLFLELSYDLLKHGGRIGMIVPSGLYSDSETYALRTLFLDKSAWDWLFSFENKRGIFDIHRSQKFASTIVERSTNVRPLKAAFMIHDLDLWDRPDPPVFEYNRELVPLFSPRSKSLPEVRTARDLEICRKVYAKSFRIGDNAPGWKVTYSCEFHMTNDSGCFSPLEKWKARGYEPEVFGRWIGPQGDLALPLYEGRMIGQFDFSQKGWVSGKGRSAVWREVRADEKRIEPQYLMDSSTFYSSEKAASGWKLVGMSIVSATNSRTAIAACQEDIPCNHALFTLRLTRPFVGQYFLLEALVDSLVFDYVTRQRVGGLNLSWFILELHFPRNPFPPSIIT